MFGHIPWVIHGQQALEGRRRGRGGVCYIADVLTVICAIAVSYDTFLSRALVSSALNYSMKCMLHAELLSHIQWPRSFRVWNALEWSSLFSDVETFC